MVEKGARLKEHGVLDLQETDAPISQTWLLQTFFGSDPHIKSLATQVIRELGENEDTKSLIVTRKNGTHHVASVTDSELFKRMMVEKGARLR